MKLIRWVLDSWFISWITCKFHSHVDVPVNLSRQFPTLDCVRCGRVRHG